MDKIRISVVRYANSYPFIWGLKHGGLDDEAIIETDHPAICAEKLAGGRADIGLVPVAALPEINNYKIISNYCIGAYRKVKTVMLLSNSSFEDINNIYLDYRSRSSVALARVLAQFMWKRKFEWASTNEGFDFINIAPGEAVVLIGDQCFELEPHFAFGLDLAEEWKRYTGLCFVFACWISNREIDDSFLMRFNSTLKSGLDNIDRVVDYFRGSCAMNDEQLKSYLHNNIDYNFDEDKKRSMKLFLELISRL